MEVLHLDRGNSKHKYRLMGRECTESSPGEKGLEAEKVSMGRKLALRAQNARCVQGSTKKSVISRAKEVTVDFYSTLVRLHLEHCIQVLAPQHNKDMELLERVQRRAQR